MNTALVLYSAENLRVGDWENDFWNACAKIEIKNYWSGETAPDARKSEVRMIWTDEAFFVNFEGNQFEPLNVNSFPNLKEKINGLWEGDVFEIFVAPDAKNVRRYFEFEASPTGEWLDLLMRISLEGEREPDFGYNSGMKVAAEILEGKVRAMIEIKWNAFGKKPEAGDAWRGNLFRCVGAGATRGYLAWQPTGTKEPDFHVPEKFGRFEFVK